ncbi:hypothetical protein C6Y53_06425 [Pukyongiella litopenaei]|uniref:TtsA-like Glycoside hydrolase family 108 domain-containing protein n=1 Tax=Pukyongiella litopenaei TaxID=2605946 RepID=A0A2S0MV47_9RHOB|nr:hypothetical protein C6Y53_06425 [Pukyongiella litopenaei]
MRKWEGGYVDHPRDPGGATNYGITIGTLRAWRKGPVSKADVRNLTLHEAGEIYRANYWRVLKGDELPAGLDLVAFDAGVNSGPRRGAQWLQRGLGVSADGVIGRQTKAAARAARPRVVVIQRACAARMGFLRGLGNWSTFGRGWSRRVADTEATAVAMCAPDRLSTEANSAGRASQQQGAAAAGSVAGGGGISLADLPGWAVDAAVIAGIAVAAVLVARAVHNARRKAAYASKIAKGA